MSFKMVVEEKQGVKLGVCVPVLTELRIPVKPYMQDLKCDFGKGLFPNEMFYIIFYLKHVLLLLKSWTMQENYFYPEI